MLEVKQLKRAYGEYLAVNSVSFSIEKSEIVGLLGHNGAGKTTIMKMLSGYLEPSAGNITFDGQLQSDNLKALQQKIGYLPESLPVYADMSVADYLDYAAELKNIRGVAKQKEIKRVVLATDIASKLLAPIATLSRGYKQRVGVAQAILGAPQLLILDEPTNGLDPTQTLHMRELTRDLAKNATVILSTHIMQEVDALCNRVLMIRAGELVIDAKLSDLRHSRSLLVESNKSLTELKSILATVSAIKHIDQLENRSVRIQFDESIDSRILNAQIASMIINAGGELYQLQTEMRDLEALFREVNDQTRRLNDKEQTKDAA